MKELDPAWQVVTEKNQPQKLRREFDFATFPEAVAFVNRIVPLAEAAKHHPDIHIFYNRVVLELYTHEMVGLSDKDFGLAAKIGLC